MIYKVKLTKIQSDHNNIRSNEIIGVTSFLPKMGERFQMLSEALDKSHGANTRHVETSPITNIFGINSKTLTLHTTYSIYEFEILEATDNG